MESVIERQVIRAAVAVAAASAHGRSAEAIADLRDEATQLIGTLGGIGELAREALGGAGNGAQGGSGVPRSPARDGRRGPFEGQ